MRESAPRSVAAIDADLRALQAIRRDALRELAEVRRRQSELADLEAELVVAVELRSRRIDDVLDERLRADPGAAGRLPAFSDAGRSALASVR
jgi:hypothetical protein